MFNRRGSQEQTLEIGETLKAVERSYEDSVWRTRDFIKEKLRGLAVRCADLELQNESLKDELESVKDRLSDALRELRSDTKEIV